jgi:predicted RNA methylase
MGTKDKAFTIAMEPYIKVKGEKRHTLDTYLTPVGLARLMIRRSIRDLIDTFGLKHFTQDNPMIIYDFGAGVGVFGAVAHDMLDDRGIPHRIIGFEINPAYPQQEGYDEWKVCDVTQLSASVFEKAHLVLMNPPFIKATEFVEKAIDMIVPRLGRITALLPIGFLFSKDKRREFFEKHAPRDILYVASRPSFYHLLTENVGTDAAHYSVLVFDTIERALPSRIEFEYDNTDPIHKRLQASKSMAIYALIYEASKTKEGDTCWDDLYSLMAARFYGKIFLEATPNERAGLRQTIVDQLKEKQNGS